MGAGDRWSVRIENNCLFLDDADGAVILQHNARPGLRPYIHPLRGPGGRGVLTEDSPGHHPWQHGISTGFHGVNGCDFWFDPGQRPGVVTGTIEAATPVILESGGPRWLVEAVWRDKDGAGLLVEQQQWRLREAGEGILYLDLGWRVQAIRKVHIEQAMYGGLFVRMPYRADQGAVAVNSEGRVDDACEQQDAAWVDLWMPVDRLEGGAGITICDHPSNPGHPARWRVDGQRGINPCPCGKGAIDLAPGEAMDHHYRLILHAGQVTPEKVRQLWQAYAGEPTA